MAVSYLCGFAAALFELFARAAGARIVTADPTLVGVRAGLVDGPDGSGIEICFGPFPRE